MKETGNTIEKNKDKKKSKEKVKEKEKHHKKEKSKKSSKKETDEQVTSSKSNLLIGDYSELATPDQQFSPVHSISSSISRQQVQTTTSSTNFNATANGNSTNVGFFNERLELVL